MSPEQLQIVINENRRVTEETIRVVVNGKIDRLTQKVEDHIDKHTSDMEDVRLIIEAYKGARVVGNLVKWVSGVLLATIGMWAILKGILRL